MIIAIIIFSPPKKSVFATSSVTQVKGDQSARNIVNILLSYIRF